MSTVRCEANWDIHAATKTVWMYRTASHTLHTLHTHTHTHTHTYIYIRTYARTYVHTRAHVAHMYTDILGAALPVWHITHRTPTYPLGAEVAGVARMKLKLRLIFNFFLR